MQSRYLLSTLLLVCSAATLIYYHRTSFLSTRLVAEDGSKEDIQ